MPTRRNPVVTVNTTKFRKKGLVLDKPSSQRLMNVLNIKFYEMGTQKVRVNGQSFYPMPRKDNRIEIPASVIRKARIKSGKHTFELVRADKGDLVKGRRVMGTARTITDTTQKYYEQRLEDVDLRVLVADIYYDCYKKSLKNSHFYFKLEFLLFEVKLGENEVYPFVKIFELQESADAFSNTELLIAQIRGFVEQTWSEMLIMKEKKQKYIVEIFFNYYSVRGKNVKKETVRVRNI